MNFVLGKVYENYPKIEEKFYFTKLTWKSNINQKPIIWSRDKIMTKFGQKKKWMNLVLDKVFENCTKIKEKCNFMKLTSKGVISIENHLFGLKTR